MKTELKAYKAIFPALWDYHDDAFHDSSQYTLIYGKTQKEATRNYCQRSDGWSYWELKEAIRTRRFPEADLYSQERHFLLNGLTENQIGHLTHSLGVTIGDLCPKSFYRNYSIYREKHEECEILVALGLMENWRAGIDNSEVYAVSDTGILAVKTLLLTTKH